MYTITIRNISIMKVHFLNLTSCFHLISYDLQQIAWSNTQTIDLKFNDSMILITLSLHMT